MALYEDCDETGDDAVSVHSPISVPSSFTAINTPPSKQPLTSCGARRVSPVNYRPREHNPIVADYLGLGHGVGTSKFDRTNMPSVQPTNCKRKRAAAKDKSTANRKPQKKAHDPGFMSDGLQAEDTQPAHHPDPLPDCLEDEFPADGCDYDEVFSMIEDGNTMDRVQCTSAVGPPDGAARGPLQTMAIDRLSCQKLNMKPIVRPQFPAHVRDGSAVIGLSSARLLRTCFRVGEAINAGRSAAKMGQRIIIELYARVLRSERSETRQHFVLCDLFHSKPPYLEAAYDAAIWRSVELHDVDSAAFLVEENRMCRCILGAKSNGKEWAPSILNIWAAKLEDITWVEGIVNS